MILSMTEIGENQVFKKITIGSDEFSSTDGEQAIFSKQQYDVASGTCKGTPYVARYKSKQHLSENQRSDMSHQISDQQDV